MIWASIWLFIFMAALGVVGTMDYHDQIAVEEFRKDYAIVTDDHGEPQLVEVQNAKPMRKVQEARALPRKRLLPGEVFLYDVQGTPGAVP